MCCPLLVLTETLPHRDTSSQRHFLTETLPSSQGHFLTGTLSHRDTSSQRHFLPHRDTSSQGHFLTETLPPAQGHFLTETLPSSQGHFLTETLPHRDTSSQGHFCTETLPSSQGHFLTGTLPETLPPPWWGGHACLCVPLTLGRCFSLPGSPGCFDSGILVLPLRFIMSAACEPRRHTFGLNSQSHYSQRYWPFKIQL